MLNKSNREHWAAGSRYTLRAVHRRGLADCAIATALARTPLQDGNPNYNVWFAWRWRFAAVPRLCGGQLGGDPRGLEGFVLSYHGPLPGASPRVLGGAARGPPTVELRVCAAARNAPQPPKGRTGHVLPGVAAKTRDLETAPPAVDLSTEPLAKDDIVRRTSALHSSLIRC